ncbi:MAG TPA: hypothetical protein VFU88_01360, partial [Ktedonobacterales bacterium]|nr:hypothetical protein [Ktedonobacterales bacterium]
MSVNAAADGRAMETAPSTDAEAAGGGGLSSFPREDSVAEMAISDLFTNGMPDDVDDVADRVRRIDVRGALDRERVEAYKMALKRGEDLGPILVAVIDGVPHVASGWHRTVAHIESGRDSVAAIRRHMTMVEAVEAAIEGNRRHGHSPTAADV